MSLACDFEEISGEDSLKICWG